MSENKIVRVANAQGFWGDSLLGPLRLVEEGPVDYLTFDYLAEITMSIMQKQRMRKPETGYALDFIPMLEKILPACKEKGIKIIANAGGVNPRGCLEAAAACLVRELDRSLRASSSLGSALECPARSALSPAAATPSLCSFGRAARLFGSLRSLPLGSSPTAHAPSPAFSLI